MLQRSKGAVYYLQKSFPFGCAPVMCDLHENNRRYAVSYEIMYPKIPRWSKKIYSREVGSWLSRPVSRYLDRFLSGWSRNVSRQKKEVSLLVASEFADLQLNRSTQVVEAERLPWMAWIATHGHAFISTLFSGKFISPYPANFDEFFSGNSLRACFPIKNAGGWRK